MKKLLLFLLFGITIFLSFPTQPAQADADCPDQGHYYDSNVRSCVFKHGGYRDRENQCADSEGCIYAFNKVPDNTPGCPPPDSSNPNNPPDPNSVEGVIGRVAPPNAVSRMGFGAAGINVFLNRTVELIYGIAGVIFVFMIIVSALQWMMSGGDKEAVGNARNRLMYAIIGIALLALTFVLLSVVGQITGFKSFGPGNLPPGCYNPV